LIKNLQDKGKTVHLRSTCLKRVRQGAQKNRASLSPDDAGP
jgi:hypothetical protein